MHSGHDAGTLSCTALTLIPHSPPFHPIVDNLQIRVPLSFCEFTKCLHFLPVKVRHGRKPLNQKPLPHSKL